MANRQKHEDQAKCDWAEIYGVLFDCIGEHKRSDWDCHHIQIIEDKILVPVRECPN